MTGASVQPVVDLRRAERRYSSDLGWLDSKHSFSFGPHFDWQNTHHGLLLVNNDDRVTAGSGFDTHPHRDMEIVTWVLEGSLIHQDSMGNSGVIYPGLAQRMTAGTGIMHSEKNDSWRVDGNEHHEPVHFIQMWVAPDSVGISPSYEQREIASDDLAGGLMVVASGMSRDADLAAIRIRNQHAALHVARLQPGESVELPMAPWLHVYLARGAADLEGTGAILEGDAVRLTASGGQRITALDASELMVWEMHASLDR